MSDTVNNTVEVELTPRQKFLDPTELDYRAWIRRNSCVKGVPFMLDIKPSRKANKEDPDPTPEKFLGPDWDQIQKLCISEPGFFKDEVAEFFGPEMLQVLVESKYRAQLVAQWENNTDPDTRKTDTSSLLADIIKGKIIPLSLTEITKALLDLGLEMGKLQNSLEPVFKDTSLTKEQRLDKAAPFMEQGKVLNASYNRLNEQAKARRRKPAAANEDES